MRELRVTDEFLYQYMPLVDDALIKELESQTDCQYRFSATFKKKMKALMEEEKKIGFWRNIRKHSRRVAGIVLIVFMTLFISAMSVEAFRTKFIENMKSVFEKMEWNLFGGEEPEDSGADNVLPVENENREEMEQMPEEVEEQIVPEETLEESLPEEESSNTVIQDQEGESTENVEREEPVTESENAENNYLAPEYYKQGTGRWLYEVKADHTLRLTGYSDGSLKGDVVLPSSIDGLKITAIGPEAFAENCNIRTLTIPKGIAVIESNAFKGFSGFNTLIITEGVKEVAPDAFEWNGKQRSAGVGKIVFCTGAQGAKAWAKSGVFQNLGATAYYLDTDKSWTEEAKNSMGASLSWEAYRSEKDSSGVLWAYQMIEGKKAKLFGYLGSLPVKNIQIPEHFSGIPVTELQENIFADSDVETVEVSGNVQKIGEYAFADCDELRSIHISSGVKELGAYMFENCEKLENVKLEEGIVNIGDRAFFFCRNLKKIKLPDTVEKIGEESFRHCTQLETVTLSKNLKEIGDGAFISCGSLNGIQFPEGFLTIGKKSFEHCYRLSRLEIPKTVTTIGERAFAGNERLDSIRFYGNAPKIEAEAFYDVNAAVYYLGRTKGWTKEVMKDYGGSLSWISYDVPEENGDAQEWMYLVNADGTLTLTGYTATNPSRVLVVPTQIGGKKVIAIAPSALGKLEKVEEITVPEQILEIGKRAFYGSSDLKKVTIQSPVTVLSEELFAECTALREVQLPETVENLEKGVFQNSGLETCTLPKNVKSIGETVFYDCENLRKIIVPEGVTSIGALAFARCGKLDEIELPNSLTTLGSYAFSQCTALRKIVLPENLTVLNTGIFSQCEKLETVQIPSTIKVLPESLFLECRELKNVMLPNSLEEIGVDVFQFCEGLDEINIPASVRKIGNFAFRNCTGLNRITFSGKAPVTGEAVFGNVIADVYYPDEEQTWNKYTMEDISRGSTKLTWVGVVKPTEEVPEPTETVAETTETVPEPTETPEDEEILLEEPEDLYYN